MFIGLREKHKQELENLSLTSQPFKTFKLFIVAITEYLRRSLVYLLTHGVWLMLFTMVTFAGGVLLLSADGPHGKVCHNILNKYIFLQLKLYLLICSRSMLKSFSNM